MVLFSLISRFTIFSLARRGKVLPFFNQYCTFFRTHRIFRQYLFTLIAPVALFTGLVNLKYLNHTEHLWAVHARRMNQQYQSHLTIDWLQIQKTANTHKSCSQPAGSDHGSLLTKTSSTLKRNTPTKSPSWLPQTMSNQNTNSKNCHQKKKPKPTRNDFDQRHILFVCDFYILLFNQLIYVIQYANLWDWSKTHSIWVNHIDLQKKY